VFEILSPGNRRAEMARKLKFYGTHGAEEYYVYDPDHNKLEIYLRQNGALQSVIYQDYWISPLLKIKFEWTTETLLLSKPNGEPFLSYLELVEFHDQAVEALSESRQLLKMEQQRFQELSKQNEAIQQRYEQARKQALVEQDRAKQQRFIAEQESLRAEQESQRAEQILLKAEQEKQRVKASIKAFQRMGISNAEIAEVLGLTETEFATYLLAM
jgi:hypothetical protein